MAFYDEVHATKKFRLGTRVRSSAGNEFIYLQGIGSTVVGSWVNMDGGTAYVTALVDTDVAATVVGRIAVAMAAVVADQFGWYQVYGHGSGLSLTGSADGVALGATATAGSLDDGTFAAEVHVAGVASTGAVNETTLLQAVALSYPTMHGQALD
jgi:hypothetical protein